MQDAVGWSNEIIRSEHPALAALLSPLGRRIAFPPDIPFQAGQAKGKAFNGTIGQITDGHGRPVPLSPMDEALSGLPEAARHRALLYSPVAGLPAVRSAWRAWQRRGLAEGSPSTLPLVTVGLTHGLSLVADLFGGPGRRIVVPAPFWGNYRQTFSVRTGAAITPVPLHTEDGLALDRLADALGEVPDGEPVVVVLNFPSNPGGYSPTVVERDRLESILVAASASHPILALCDDAYAGLVYDDEIERGSLFWRLAGRTPGLVPVKVDGATKELSFFGGRVGFVTFPFAPDGELAAALESKMMGLSRGTIGSPVATSQVVLGEALAAAAVEEEVEAVRRLLADRARSLARALAAVDRGLVRPLPFNSGCFALVEIPDALGLESETVRQHLLAHHDTGLVAIAPRFLRIAFCSVAADALPELVRRLELGIRELAGGRSAPVGPGD